MKFTEAQLEKAIVGLLEKEGYTQFNGEVITRDSS